MRTTTVRRVRRCGRRPLPRHCRRAAPKTPTLPRSWFNGGDNALMAQTSGPRSARVRGRQACPSRPAPPRPTSIRGGRNETRCVGGPAVFFCGATGESWRAFRRGAGWTALAAHTARPISRQVHDDGCPRLGSCRPARIVLGGLPTASCRCKPGRQRRTSAPQRGCVDTSSLCPCPRLDDAAAYDRRGELDGGGSRAAAPSINGW